MNILIKLGLQCKHEWKLLSDTTSESSIEVATKALPMSQLKSFKLPHQTCHTERLHEQVFTCEKCGKIKRYKQWV